MTIPTTPPEPDLPSVAVLTMVRDEGQMLRRWVAHYAGQVGADHVVVVDDHSVDGSTEDLPCPVLRIPYLHKKPFEPARMGLLGGLSAGLLEVYDAVVFCDADEFIVADPAKYPTLRHFVAARPGRQAVGVMALNVVHDVRREEPLSDDAPILSQRRLAKFLPLMCKPSLKWVPAPWVLASHGIRCPFEVDPELYMFHMKFADRDHLHEVARHRHVLSTTENRAKRTSWDRPEAEMVAILDDVAEQVTQARIPMFRPQGVSLRRIVQQEGDDVWRATGAGQVQAMRNRPLVKIPHRFRELF